MPNMFSAFYLYFHLAFKQFFELGTLIILILQIKKQSARKVNSLAKNLIINDRTPRFVWIQSLLLLLSLFSRVDSVRLQRWQPTRLPRPWDSPGKNTGVGCQFLLQCMKVESEKWKKSLSRVRLLAIPWTAAHQAPPPMEFSRQEYWNGVPLPIYIKKNIYLFIYFQLCNAVLSSAIVSKLSIRSSDLFHSISERLYTFTYFSLFSPPLQTLVTTFLLSDVLYDDIV